MKSFAEFKAAIRMREGSGDYACVNRLGYLGAYQFGMARLCDLGLATRKMPGSKGLANSLFEFVPPLTREGFLADSALQDITFDRHALMLGKLCARICPENLSGAVAACHLLGVGGLVDFVRHRVDSVDGFGTKLSEYYHLFEGYMIPCGTMPGPGPAIETLPFELEFEVLSIEELLELEERGILVCERDGWRSPGEAAPFDESASIAASKKEMKYAKSDA